MLYSSLHELVHHFAGYLICGDWGYKSFNYFSTACEDDPKTYYATYAGPVFSFLIMYVGMYYLGAKSDYRKHLGFALIFAQLPLQRMLMPIFRGNDEYYASYHLFGDSNAVWIITILVVWVICLPPLIRAYRAIGNRQRLLWFLLYLVLLPHILWGPFFALFEYMMVDKGILAQTVIGIGLLFIINEVFTIALYYLVRKWIDPLRTK